MAATEDYFELSNGQQHRFETAIQTVADRRNGDLSVAIVAEQADLSEGIVREVLDRAAAAGTRITRNEGYYEVEEPEESF